MITAGGNPATQLKVALYEANFANENLRNVSTFFF